MNTGDTVKLKTNKKRLKGVIVDENGVYSSWGEYHILVEWRDGKTEYCPVKMLEVVDGNREPCKSKKE